MRSSDFENSDVAKIGLAFARALAGGDYQAAHGMLASQLRDDLQPSDLKAHYEQMTSYWTAPADKIEVTYVDPPGTDWPGKDQSDLGWAYVSIDSCPPNHFACLEQVCVRVVRQAGRNLIAQVEWGRP